MYRGIASVPTLQAVMRREGLDEALRDSAAWTLRALPVLALRLTTGAPCAGHRDLFAPWPGDETHVTRWFELDGGHAVGIAERPDRPQQVHLWTAAPGHD